MPIRTLVTLVAVAACLAAPATAQDAPSYEGAVSAFRSGDYAAAARGFEAVLDAQPTWAPGHLILGQCYWLLDRDEDGARHMDEAKRLDPSTDLFRAYVAVGEQLYRTRRYDDAVRPFQLALEQAGDDGRADASLRLADALLLAERYGDARREFERHHREFAADRRSSFRLALACRRLDDYPCALRNARAALEMPGDDPSDGRLPRYVATWSQAWALAQQDDGRREALLRQAVEDTRGWAEAEPDLPEARRLHGETMLAAGRPGDVIERFAPAADAGDCVAAVLAARAHLALDDAAAAEGRARQATECAPGAADGWTELGAALVAGLSDEHSTVEEVRRDVARAEEALAALRRSTTIEPGGRAQALSDAVEATVTRLTEAEADLVAHDRIHAADVERVRAAEIRERCRALIWKRRDDTTGLTDDERRWFDEHDCRQYGRDAGGE